MAPAHRMIALVLLDALPIDDAYILLSMRSQGQGGGELVGASTDN